MKTNKCKNDICNILKINICCCDCKKTSGCDSLCPAYKLECEKRYMD